MEKVGIISNKTWKKLILLLWIGVVFVNIKSILADFGPDQTYAIATSYRHVMGDGMFTEMWEPHQTSSFIADAGLWIYKFFVPSLEGVAIFLQVYGALLYGIVTYVVFVQMKKVTSVELAHFAAILFNLARAKLMVFPEFSNMHTAFSMLLVIALYRFLVDQTKTRHLVVSAVLLCLLVLSYPSCLITYLGVVISIILMSQRKGRDILIVTGISFLIGLIYAGYFAITIGVTEFIRNLKLIFYSDASHTGTTFVARAFLGSFVQSLLWMIPVLAVAYLLSRLIKKSFYYCFVGTLVAGELFILGFSRFVRFDVTTNVFIVYIALMVFGLIKSRELERQEKMLWTVSMIISLCSFVAVGLLTNQGLLSLFAYMVPGIVVSIIPVAKTIGKSGAQAFYVLTGVLFVLLLHRGITVYGYINVQGNYLITDVENIVRVGPEKGIVTSLSKCNENRDGINDYKTYTNLGDKVLMIYDAWCDPIVYLYNQSEVAIYSTIDTPTYGENLGEYWKVNPHKKPDVIAVYTWAGIEVRNQEGWLADYIDEGYHLEGEGTFWRFYKRIK